MPTHDLGELQADALALTVATHHNDTTGLRAVLEPYLGQVPDDQATPIAGLLTMLAKLLGESFTVLAAGEGLDFDTFAQAAGQLGAERRARSATEPRACTVCGTRVELADADDPESYVHAEDGDWGDHTAEVN